MVDFLISLTDWRQLVLDLQDDPLAHILQQTNDLIMTKLCQVDTVHRLNVVPYVQLVTPAHKQTKK